MKKLILLLSALASQAMSQELPDAKALESCWDNVEHDRRPGSHPNLCFGPEDVTVTFWTPSRDLDYAEEQWALLPDSTLQIADKECRYRLEGDVLSISDCVFQGTFERFKANKPRRR